MWYNFFDKLGETVFFGVRRLLESIDFLKMIFSLNLSFIEYVCFFLDKFLEWIFYPEKYYYDKLIEYNFYYTGYQFYRDNSNIISINNIEFYKNLLERFRRLKIDFDISFYDIIDVELYILNTLIILFFLYLIGSSTPFAGKAFKGLNFFYNYGINSSGFVEESPYYKQVIREYKFYNKSFIEIIILNYSFFFLLFYKCLFFKILGSNSIDSFISFDNGKTSRGDIKVWFHLHITPKLEYFRPGLGKYSTRWIDSSQLASKDGRSVYMSPYLDNIDLDMSTFFTQGLYVDFFKLFLVLLYILYLLLFLDKKKSNFEYLLILQISFISILLLMMSNEFIGFFLIIEIISMCLYILSAYDRGSTLASESGLKYFIYGTLASILMLYGIVLLYYITGTLKFNEIFILLNTNLDLSIYFVLFISILFILIGVIFKLGLFPFNYWMVEVYNGVSNSIFHYLMVFPKFVYFIVFFKLIFFIFYPFQDQFIIYLYIISLMSIFLGILGSYYTPVLKKFLLYSSLTNNGFILLSISSYSWMSFIISNIYLLIYNFFSFFLLIINYNIRLYKSGNLINISSFKDLNILYTNNRFVTMVIVLYMFSMVGIPPFSGFVLKLLIFITLFKNSSIYSLFIIIFVLFLTLFMSMAYLRFISFIMFQKQSNKFFLLKFKCLFSFIISLFFALNILFFFYFKIIYLYINYLFNDLLIYFLI